MAYLDKQGNQGDRRDREVTEGTGKWDSGTVFVLGAGFTKAFLPEAPLLIHDYSGDDLKRNQVQNSTRTWAGNTAIPARVARAVASTETFLRCGSRARCTRPASLMPAHADSSTSSSEVMPPRISRLRSVICV